MKELFQQALQMPAGERQAFIEAATAADESLRKEVHTLLSSHDAATDFLNNPPRAAAAEVTELHDRASRVGDHIGPYKVLRRIGRGGTGSVYLAVRDDDEFQRRVAIKLVRRGMATADILRRFRSERQILASIDHPYIAHLLDGGSTDDGVPYFVMEYIEGEPINVYCDRNRLSIEERLALFCQVCSAVQVAHQNLVVHRDIKPGNILVSAAGVPKLLDFGIAKLLNPELSAAVDDPTLLELRVMTPEYASPEQMRGGAITTASDVYSLGILLYELLAGRRPYQLDNLPMPDMELVVCTTHPSRPSDAVSQPDVARVSEGSVPIDAATVAQARGEAPERLRRALAGDLDNIVLMALRKEPNRRYSSVEHFADDIQRHLKGLPVTARADTLGYRVGKFVGRHRLGVAVGITAVLFGLALATTIVVQAGQVAAERDRAQRAAERATAVSDFLQEIMASADPIEGMGRDVTVIESVEAAVPRIGSTFDNQPHLQAAVRHTIGTTFLRLGRLEEAEEQLRLALAIRREMNGAANLDVAATLNSLGEVLYDRGDLEGSEQLFRESLEMREALLGREHADVAWVLDNVANTAHDRGDLDQAESMYREVLQIRRLVLSPEHQDIASSLNNLASIHHDRAELDDAERLYRESLALSRVALGDEHPDVATSLANLAALLLCLVSVLTRQSRCSGRRSA